MARKQLWRARRRMSTEVIFLVNELFTEFFTTNMVVICGIIFRDSAVVTSLNNDLSWDEVPPFLAVQSVPELLDAWLIIVYLRYIGLDWPALARSLVAQRRFSLAKVLTVVASFLLVINMGIRRDYD